MKRFRSCPINYRVPLVAFVSVLAGVLSLSAQDTSWQNAVDGDWFDGTKWSDGVPDGKNALINNTGADFTVWVTNDVAASARGLTVENSAVNQTTVILQDGGITHTNGIIAVRQGARADVRADGVWRYNGPHTEGGVVLYTIRNGGEIRVNGGELLLTNMTSTVAGEKRFYVGESSAGTLTVTNGLVDLRSLVNQADSKNRVMNYFGVSSGGDGTLRVLDGGVVNMGAPSAGFTPMRLGASANSRGRLEIDGGTVNLDIASDWNRLWVGEGGLGELIVTNNGAFLAGAGRLYVGGGTAGEGRLHVFSGELRVSSLLAPWNWLGTGKEPVGEVLISGGYVNFGTSCNIAYTQENKNGSAVGSMEITGGRVELAGQALSVGLADPNKATGGGYSNRVEAVFRMSGGSFWLDPYWVRTGTSGPIDHEHSYQLNGITVGAIGYHRINNPDTGSSAYGRFEFSGGVITNRGNMAIGVSGGTGVVVQTGGDLVHQRVEGNRYTMIGYAAGNTPEGLGGVGEYHMSGGTFSTRNETFVGGVPTNITYYSVYGSQGLLEVTGGNFSVTNTLYVGGHGNGTVRMGADGTLWASNLNLFSDEATLEFDLGPAGIGDLVVNGTLTVHEDARLRVDVSNYDIANGARVKLLSCGSRSGDFKAENIEIVGAPAILEQDQDDLWLVIRSGTLLLLR